MSGPCDKTQEREVPGIRGAAEYFGRTDAICAEHGGNAPPCPSCHKPLTPVDDHGRFTCTNFGCPSNVGKDFGEMMAGDGSVWGEAEVW